jgi:hypothetical protein
MCDLKCKQEHVFCPFSRHRKHTTLRRPLFFLSTPLSYLIQAPYNFDTEHEPQLSSIYPHYLTFLNTIFLLLSYFLFSLTYFLSLSLCRKNNR